MKYTESDGKVVKVESQSTSDWVRYAHTAEQIDWLAVYDATTDKCYYVHSSLFDGMQQLSLRLTATANNQRKLVRWATDHLHPMPPPSLGRSGSRLPLPAPPE